jgi:hypothetical protein
MIKERSYVFFAVGFMADSEAVSRTAERITHQFKLKDSLSPSSH